MEDKELEKPEAVEETAIQPETGRALQDEPGKEKRVLAPIATFVLVFLGVMY